MNDMEDEFSDFLHNQSFMFNETAANASSTYTEVMSPVMDKIINILMSVVMFTTMVSMGCTMELLKIKHHIMKPKGVVIAALAQFGIMPLAAFSLAKAFKVQEIAAVTVLICGCCPGGSLSNILTLFLQGDMNLSIVMTSCSSLLALGMMPLLLYIYCQGFDLQNSVPYLKIITSLVMLLIPCSIGILINHYRPQYSKMITKVGIIFLLIAVVALGTLSSIGIGESILTVLSPQLMAIATLMPFTGYAFGYIISWISRLSQPERRTVSMETGCQNVPLCIAILKLAFPVEQVGALFLFPMVYAAMQMMEAAVLIVMFRGHQWYTLKKKEKYQAAVTEDELKEKTEGAA
ncbi:hepatic sodium/bile acid cotransporter [Centropristis striata]|uniref:hepatic sodium/bile acid cotransporter n=1 Tax=Centropristis striata TaxID=184440 RepID=UPI0027DEDA4F|nr:hepatic sodium/bile acid cotransporter [Centropristis striata]